MWSYRYDKSTDKPKKWKTAKIEVYLIQRNSIHFFQYYQGGGKSITWKMKTSTHAQNAHFQINIEKSKIIFYGVGVWISVGSIVTFS